MLLDPTLFALIFTLGAASSGAPPAVETALTRALTLPGSQIKLVDYRSQAPLACAISRAEAAKPVAGSGRVAVHLFGKMPWGEDCEGWAWATVRVFSRVLVTSRAVREGEPLEAAVWPDVREVLEGRSPLVQLAEKATAARALPAGQTLFESDQRLGPRPGDPLTVSIRVGALEVEEAGRAISCSRGRACAVLPSGKRVEGSYERGRLLVGAP